MNVIDVKIKDIEIVENVRVEVKDKDLVGLMESIKQRGLQNPIYVGKTKSGRYVLISGHRRMTACSKLGWNTIPANVTTEPEIIDLLLDNSTENLQRLNITPMEFGRICQRLLDLKLTIPEIASRLSVTKSMIEQALNTYKGIPEEFKGKVEFMSRGINRQGKIPATLATKVLSIKKDVGLTEAQTSSLLSETRNRELTYEDLKVVSSLIKAGLSPSKATKESTKYKCYRIDICLSIEDVNKLASQHNLSPIMTLKEIIYGEVKTTLKKPDFIQE